MSAAFGQWLECTAAGEAPLPLKGLSLGCVGSRVYVFGGYGGGFSDDVHVLDLRAEAQWYKLQLLPPAGAASGAEPDKPKRRAYHSCVEFAGELYVFGGAGAAGLYDDVWRLSLEERRGVMAGRWHACDAVGCALSKRRDHTATALPEAGLMVVIGGFDGVEFKNDVHALNLETLVWWKCCICDAPNAPLRRSAHSAAKVPNRDAVVIFGGYNKQGCTNDAFVVQVDAMQATARWDGAFEALGEPPTQRYGHACCAFEKNVFVFGGAGPVTGYGADPSGSVTHGDMAVLSFANAHKVAWRRDQFGHAFEGAAPSPRHSHAGVLCGELFVIVGGSTRGTFGPNDPFPPLLNDFGILKLRAKDQDRAGAAGALSQSAHSANGTVFTDATKAKGRP
ncbi:hypothetical protein M885DRAFT_611394 [Pelagophyceae sp. CCMP2097]|nr:hypothetical protein M885DRAFT_611394 [Pelagophyceae sp. CCMP2097]|mmetsp:Transcript_89/g.359  ORF Transcript_89/g.359 Transcript_89/m.359 type:complete len:393 (+) Transcript_89:123-1301(+)